MQCRGRINKWKKRICSTANVHKVINIDVRARRRWKKYNNKIKNIPFTCVRRWQQIQDARYKIHLIIHRCISSRCVKIRRVIK